MATLTAGWTGTDTRLIAAALIAAVLIGIVLIVVLITKVRPHPFLGLILGSGALGPFAGMPVDKL